MMIGLARPKHHAWEGLMIDGIRELLRLKSETAPVTQWHSIFSISLAIEEITAIKLYSRLVSRNNHLSS